MNVGIFRKAIELLIERVQGYIVTKRI